MIGNIAKNTSLVNQLINQGILKNLRTKEVLLKIDRADFTPEELPDSLKYNDQ